SAITSRGCALALSSAPSTYPCGTDSADSAGSSLPQAATGTTSSPDNATRARVFLPSGRVVGRSRRVLPGREPSSAESPGRGAIGPQGAVRDPGEPGRSIAVAPESRRRGAWPAAGLPPLFAGASPPSPPSPEPPVPVRARTAL